MTGNAQILQHMHTVLLYSNERHLKHMDIVCYIWYTTVVALNLKTARMLFGFLEVTIACF